MNKFIRIVDRHRRLYEIGSIIMENHKHIHKCSPSSNIQYTDQERQIKCIKKFISESKKLEDDWQSNSSCIHKYWSGLSM